jgi:hypothetical protein
MTTRRRAPRRRREDDGPRAGAGDTASADHEQRAPSPELLRLQALGGNAAVQRLVTGARQLQRQELEEEEQPTATETGAAGAGAVMASMWSIGVLGPLGQCLEHSRAARRRI